MATVGTNYNTLADLVARTEPDGSFARKIADRVGRTNQLLQFLPFVRSNKVDGNTIVQATKLPTVGYIKYNKAPTKSKGETVQVTDAVSRLKVFSDVDCELADSHIDKEAFRSSEDMLFVEAMNQQVASDLIYSTTVTTPEKFDGLAPRYGAATATRNNYGYYMISGGGSGSDNTSIWVLRLDESDGVHGLFGKAGKAGLDMTDHGKVWGPDASGNDMQWYRSEYRWEVGLQVRRPGAAVRICNIDKSALVGESSPADLSKLLQRACKLIETGPGRTVIVMNKTTQAWLEIQASQETTLGLTKTTDTFGEEIMAFRGKPIVMMDALTNAEATVAGTFQTTI